MPMTSSASDRPRLSLGGLVALWICLGAIAASAATTTTSTLFDPARMMRAADLRPGMKGYGLTVFHGIEPERFDAEVVGVRHRAFPGDDMILCRLSHPMLQEIGVIAGMSGSPVYINDKLIGAVAYGWTFSKEPLAGITPIESMLRVMEATSDNLRDPDDTAGSVDTFNAYCQMRQTLQFAPLTQRQAVPPLALHKSEFVLAPQASASLPESFELVPLAAPLYTSLSSPLGLSMLRSAFPGCPIYATSLAGGGDAGSEQARLAENSPGGPVPDLESLAAKVSGGYGLAVPLLEGDLALAGVGTVSYRDGDRLVAFGHPMFGFGVVRYPMAPARINAIVRSVNRPFKLGESLGTIGVIRQDRLPAVGGVFGKSARTFNIHVVVEDAEYRGRREFNYRAWNDKEYGPTLVGMALTESLVAAGRYEGEAAVQFRYSTELDDGTTFTKEDYFVDSLGGGTAGIAVMAELGMLTTNPYKRVAPRQIDFSATIHPRYPEAQLLAISADKPLYQPGERVRLVIELQPYRMSVTREITELSLPDDLPDGDYDLVVCNSLMRQSLDAARNPAKGEIRDYPSLLERVRTSYPRNRIYVALLDRDTGSAVRGQELARLPSSVITTLESSTEPPHYAAVRGNFLWDRAQATGWEISGRQHLTLKVRRAGHE